MSQPSHYFEELPGRPLSPEEAVAETLEHDFVHRDESQRRRRSALMNALLTAGRFHRYSWVFLDHADPIFTATRPYFRKYKLDDLQETAREARGTVAELARQACAVCVFQLTCGMAEEGLAEVLLDQTKKHDQKQSQGSRRRQKLRRYLETHIDPAPCPDIINPGLRIPRPR